MTTYRRVGNEWRKLEYTNNARYRIHRAIVVNDVVYKSSYAAARALGNTTPTTVLRKVKLNIDGYRYATDEEIERLYDKD